MLAKSSRRSDHVFDAALLAAVAFIAADAAGILLSGFQGLQSRPMGELVAVAAPSRAIVATLLAMYALLLGYCGSALWREESEPVRLIGELVTVIAAMTLAINIVFPLHLLEKPHVWSSALHMAFAAVTAVLMAAAMFTSVRRIGWPWRIVTIVCIIAFAIGATAVLIEAPALVNELATPLIGIFQRVAGYSFIVWLCTFAYARRPHRAHDTLVAQSS